MAFKDANHLAEQIKKGLLLWMLKETLVVEQSGEEVHLDQPTQSMRFSDCRNIKFERFLKHL